MHYLVLEIGSRQQNAPPGYPQLKTFASPLAVFEAASAEEACRAAAVATKRLTTYFAIPGIVWGVEMLPTDEAGEFQIPGPEADTEKRLRQLEERIGQPVDASVEDEN